MQTWYFVEYSKDALKVIEDNTTVRMLSGDKLTYIDILEDIGITKPIYVCYDPSDKAITKWNDNGNNLEPQEEITKYVGNDIEAKILTLDEFIEQLHKGGF